MELLKIIIIVLSFVLVVFLIGYCGYLLSIPEKEKKHSIKRINRLFAKHLALIKRSEPTIFTKFEVTWAYEEIGKYSLTGTYELHKKEREMETTFIIRNGLSLEQNIIYTLGRFIGHNEGERQLIEEVFEVFDGDYGKYLDANYYI